MSGGHVVQTVAEPETIFGNPLPPREMAMWSLLDEGQRAVAMRRAAVLVRWEDDRRGLAASRAADAAGVTTVRFYQMAARWRMARSLASLGVAAAPESGRRSRFATEVNAVLQSEVVKLVASEGDRSVRYLALRLAELARGRGVADQDLPSHNTLRVVVEREMRRVRQEGEVGNALLLDHATCGILRPDGTPWTMFAVVDAASQLIMGAAVGDPASAARGYAAAAGDARRRIASPSFGRLPWATRLASVQIVPGEDGAEALRHVAVEAAAGGVGLNFTADRKAGRYLEQKIGRSIATLPIWPARQGAPRAPAWVEDRASRLDRRRADARLALAVDDRDAARTAELQVDAPRGPPSGIHRLLDVLAD